MRLPCQGCKSNGTTDAFLLLGQLYLSQQSAFIGISYMNSMLSHDRNKGLMLSFNRKSGVAMMDQFLFPSSQ